MSPVPFALAAPDAPWKQSPLISDDIIEKASWVRARGDNMHIELIKEFQVFALTQNLSKAAKELHMTQSCLGKHMAELESETGLELINHDSKRVSLAPAGKYFAQETSTMIAVWEDCLKRCKEIQKQAQESLSIAIFLEGNPSNDILFQLGRDYRKERKGAEVTFSKLVGANPIESLNDGSFDITVDLCFGDCSHYVNALSESGISTLELQSSPLVIWFRNDNRIARNSNIQLEDLERIPIMTSVSSSYDYMRAATKSLFEEHGMTPFLKPVHFDIASPASFFLSDFDSRSVMLTSIGMVNNHCLSSREDICHQILDDGRLRATSFALARADNEKALSFLQFSGARLQDYNYS